MSELASGPAPRARSWAAPGSRHDTLVRFLKIALPALIGVLMAYLAMAPLSRSGDISFILDKNKVQVAKERLRVQAAQYQGRDSRGRPFVLAAQSAVQATSQQPIVEIAGMTARIQLEDGPAALRAERAVYNLESEKVAVIGPIRFTAPDGFRLLTRDVTVDLNARTLASRGPVEGVMPLGTFSADRLEANLADRRVTLVGNARMRIVQQRRG